MRSTKLVESTAEICEVSQKGGGRLRGSRLRIVDIERRPARAVQLVRLSAVSDDATEEMPRPATKLLRTASGECVDPILKWAGGKRWFARRYRDLLPDSYDSYIEPFLGGGAVFFDLTPSNGRLSDLNADLILVYQAIRDDYRKVETYLRAYAERHSKTYYYVARAHRPRGRFQIAAWLIYLNRTCWNGLYRVNKSGEFNVPIGTKNWILREGETFSAHSAALQRADIRSVDFEDAIDDAGTGAFLFVDPPYTVKHNSNGFIKYNEKVFTWADQKRLAKAIRRASKRGAHVVVLNAAHESIEELYEGFNQIRLSRHQVISGQANGRANYSELLIRNFA